MIGNINFSSLSLSLSLRLPPRNKVEIDKNIAARLVCKTSISNAYVYKWYIMISFGCINSKTMQILSIRKTRLQPKYINMLAVISRSNKNKLHDVKSLLRFVPALHSTLLYLDLNIWSFVCSKNDNLLINEMRFYWHFLNNSSIFAAYIQRQWVIC